MSILSLIIWLHLAFLNLDSFLKEVLRYNCVFVNMAPLSNLLRNRMQAIKCVSSSKCVYRGAYVRLWDSIIERKFIGENQQKPPLFTANDKYISVLKVKHIIFPNNWNASICKFKINDKCVDTVHQVRIF